MIAVLVPCWNQVEYTRKMVDSAIRNSAGHDVRFIFVDNGSEDGTSEFLAGVPKASVIRNERNLGVNPAWNQLHEAALAMDPAPELVVLANNDILCGPGWLDAPLREARKNDLRYFLPNGELKDDRTFERDAASLLPERAGKTAPARAGWCLFYRPDTIRLFHPIPKSINLWFGDDWIHDTLKKKGYEGRALLDSFCLHYISKTIAHYQGMCAQIERDKAAYRELTMPKEATNATLDQVAAIGRGLGSIPETRPELLRKLTGAVDSTACYNRFLYELMRAFGPTRVLELGTDQGRSGAHFAMGNPSAKVVTIDIDPACSRHARDLGISNLEAVTGNTLDLPAGRFQDLDLLFIDTSHTYEQARAEYDLYGPMVRSGGLIVLDDIHYSEGMERFWASISERKVDLSNLHSSGFGVVQKP